MTCQDKFEVSSGKLGSDGVNYTSAASIETCQALCQTMDDCLGISWDRTSSQCSTHTSGYILISNQDSDFYEMLTCDPGTSYSLLLLYKIRSTKSD